MSYRPTCGFQAVVRNACNAMDERLAMQSKNQNMQRTYAKNATHARRTDSILVCVAFFWRFSCVYIAVFCRAMLCISAAYAVMQCLSVCVSVTFVHCIKTHKDIRYLQFFIHRRVATTFSFFRTKQDANTPIHCRASVVCCSHKTTTKCLWRAGVICRR